MKISKNVLFLLLLFSTSGFAVSVGVSAPTGSTSGVVTQETAGFSPGNQPNYMPAPMSQVHTTTSANGSMVTTHVCAGPRCPQNGN